MNFDPSRTVRVIRRFEASAERVFDAWLDPRRAGKWLFTTPTGKIVRVEIDARVGGSFVITDRRDGEDVEHLGTYLEIERPRRLVFEFRVPKYSKEPTRVSVNIIPTASGCELTLTHEGVLPEFMERTQQGWGKILSGLGTNVDLNGAFGVITEPGTVRFERLLPGPIERVFAYLTESEKRGKWFAPGEIEPRVGGLFELRFGGSGEKAGSVYRQRIVRFEPPRIFSWTWDGGIDGPSEVTFELSTKGDQVFLVLTHRRLADRHRADIAGGWHEHLGMLVDVLSDRVPQPLGWSAEEIEKEYEKRFAAESV
jgi:uncharacterized protein YndB with AHSA1/START domain